MLSDAEYARIPECLTVSPFLFSDSATEAVQRVTSERFKMTNELRFSINKGNWQFRVTGNANLRVENLDSELSVGDAGGQQRTDFVENTLHNNPPDSLKNGLTLKRIDFILSPSVEYSFGSPMKVTLSFPVDYRISKVTRLHNNRFLLPPRLTVSGDATNNLRYNISASYNDIEGEINDLYSGYILTDHRMLARKSGVLSRTSSLAVSGRLEYKNPISGLVASAALRRSRSWRDMIFSSIIDGSRFQESALAMDNHPDNLQASINAAKRVQSLATMINTSLIWSLNESSIIRQGSMMSVRRSNIQGRITALTKFSLFLNMEYSSSLSNTSSGLSKGEPLSSIFLLRQFLLANITFRKPWIIRAEVEHYLNDLISGKDRNTLFAGLSLSYKKNRFEYSLAARNLLNRKTFNHIQTSDLIEYSSTRTLRPASVMLKILFNLR